MRNKIMITPSGVYVEEEEITDEDILMDFKKTYLNLQRALLKANLIEQVNKTSKIYEQTKKTLCKETKRGKN